MLTLPCPRESSCDEDNELVGEVVPVEPALESRGEGCVRTVKIVQIIITIHKTQLLFMVCRPFTTSHFETVKIAV